MHVEENSFSDAALLTAIRTGAGRERALKYLYVNYLPMVRQLIGQMNGGEADAKDIFQDALIVFHEQVLDGRFQEKSSIKTYLYAVSRNLWLKRLKQVGKMSVVREQEAESEIETAAVERALARDEMHQIIGQLLAELDDTCQKVLKAFYYEQLSMKAMSEQLGFANEKTAKSKKYKCLQRLIQLASQHTTLKTLIEKMI